MISVITPCLNRAQWIGFAIDSVLQQDYTHFEHIIIDGGSTDGTLDLLRQYPHLRVVSEPDQGMYDAINKGIRMAKGEIICFLNTDDIYMPDVFSVVAERFNAEAAHFDVLIGEAILFEDTPEGRRELHQFNKVAEGDLLRRVVAFEPNFNASFFRRHVFEHVGYLDSSYRCGGDAEFMIRLAISGLTYIPLEKIVYGYRKHPGSMVLSGDVEGEIKSLRECSRIAQQYLKSGSPVDIQPVFKAWYKRCYRGLLRSDSQRKNWGGVFKTLLSGSPYAPGVTLQFLGSPAIALLERLKSGATKAIQKLLKGI